MLQKLTSTFFNLDLTPSVSPKESVLKVDSTTTLTSSVMLPSTSSESSSSSGESGQTCEFHNSCISLNCKLKHETWHSECQNGPGLHDFTSEKYDSCKCALGPGGRFLKAPDTFRARKGIAKSRTLRLQSCFIHIF